MSNKLLSDECLLEIGNYFELGYTAFVDPSNQIRFSKKRLFTSKVGKRKFAQLLSLSVKSIQSASIQENSQNRLLEIVKHFLKSKVLPSSDPCILKLKRDLEAARLGISSDVFARNRGFQEFAKRSHLHRHLLKFNQQLSVSAGTKKISILHQNQMTPWEKIAPKIQYKNGAWTGHYSKNGIEEKSRYDWEKLESFMTGNPNDWGNQYAFEFVIWHQESPSLTDNPRPIDEKPRLVGIHTYIRLKTPDRENNIFCIGLYRPDKHTFSFNPFRKQDGSFNAFRTLSIRNARLMQPDETEFWGGRFSTLTVGITKEQFLAIKYKIEKDQASKNLTYQLTHDNCNEYSIELGKLAGIEISSSLHISHLILPISDDTADRFPKIIRKISSILATTAVNIFGILCGSTRVNHDAQRRDPHIRSFWDIFNPLKAEFSHPTILEKAFKKIEAWREAQIALGIPPEEIRFAVPEEYKVTASTCYDT